MTPDRRFFLTIKKEANISSHKEEQGRNKEE